MDTCFPRRPMDGVTTPSDTDLERKSTEGNTDDLDEEDPPARSPTGRSTTRNGHGRAQAEGAVELPGVRRRGERRPGDDHRDPSAHRSLHCAPDPAHVGRLQ